MQITVYKNFSKRENSTKQPTGGTAVNVLLKDFCNIESPVFELNTLDFDINYVQAFGRFYYATVTNLDGHRSELNCTIDLLASAKSNIAAYTGLIEYAASSNKVNITDPRNKPTLEILKTKTDFTFSNNPFQTYPGTYIISVISNEADGICGPNKYYAVDSYGLSQFAQHLFTGSIWTDIRNKFTDFIDAIVSCHWLPIKYDSISGSGVTNIIVGDQAVSLGDAAGKVVTNRILQISTGETVLEYPAWTGAPNIYRTYLSKAPYLTAELYLPFIGYVPLSDDIICFNNSVSIYGTIDILTGDLVYEIRSGGISIANFSGCCATNVPVASAQFNGLGVVSGAAITVGGIAATAAAIATGGTAAAIMGAAGSAIAGATQAVRSTELHTQINGSNSSAVGANLGLNPRAILIANKPINVDITSYQQDHGMPYFEVATIGSLSGFIKCHDASVAYPGNGSEQAAINGYLNSGFYYE